MAVKKITKDMLTKHGLIGDYMNELVKIVDKFYNIETPPLLHYEARYGLAQDSPYVAKHRRRIARINELVDEINMQLHAPKPDEATLYALGGRVNYLVAGRLQGVFADVSLRYEPIKETINI